MIKLSENSANNATLELLLMLAKINGVEFTDERLKTIAPVFQDLAKITTHKHPKNALNHIENTSRRLEIETSIYVDKVLKALPQLLSRSPYIIQRRFETNARALGFDLPIYRKMVIADPDQLDIIPKTLKKKLKLFREFNTRNILRNPVEKRIQKQPHILRWAAEHITLRLEYAAAIKLQDHPNFGILSGSRENIETRLVECYGHDGTDHTLHPDDDPKLLKLAQKNLFDHYDLEISLS